jgi:Lon protease-like protein
MARLVSKTMSALLLILLVGSRVAAFCPGSPNQRGQSAVTTATTTLFGIAEWRDTDFDLPGARDRPLGLASSATTPPRPVCLLPFPYSQVLLQGETKQLRLYEDRFLQLFQTVREKHCGVVAMGLLADTGIIQTVPLCEVEASTGSLGEGLGIFVTIRVVGRAQLLEVTKSEPYIQAVCVEVTDAVPAHLELPNLVAANVENYVLLLSSMEHRLNEARLEQGLEDKEMERRIAVAKMVSRRQLLDARVPTVVVLDPFDVPQWLILF